MTTLEHAPHVIRRKGYAPHYTPANLALFQPEIHDFTLELINVCFTFHSSCGYRLIVFVAKTLDSFAGKTSLDCLALFRHFMVDVIVTSSHGYRLGALSKWASGVEEPLSTAIGDFPKRGILVKSYFCVTQRFSDSDMLFSEALFPSGLGTLFAVSRTIGGAFSAILTRYVLSLSSTFCNY
jgi:hypothetical protein